MVERSAHFRSANTRLAKDIDAVSIEKISNAQRDGIPLARDFSYAKRCLAQTYSEQLFDYMQIMRGLPTRTGQVFR